jgi:putative serine protease PepD
VGFAIPISNATAIIDQLRQGHQPAYLGVSTIDADQAKLDGKKVEAADGAYVQSVASGTPADKAGVRVGDVVTAVDGKDVGSAAALGGVIRQYKPGDQVELRLERDGESRRVRVTLGEAPNS